MTKLINERVLRVTGSMIIIIRHMSKGTEYILKEGSNTNGVLFRRKREVKQRTRGEDNELSTSRGVLHTRRACTASRGVWDIILVHW